MGNAGSRAGGFADGSRTSGAGSRAGGALDPTWATSQIADSVLDQTGGVGYATSQVGSALQDLLGGPGYASSQIAHASMDPDWAQGPPVGALVDTVGAVDYAQGPPAYTLVDTVGAVDYAQGPPVSAELDADVDPTGKMLAPGSVLTAIGTSKIGGKDNVDLTAEGIHHLFTAGEDQTAIIRYLVIRCKSATGISVPAKVGLGTNTGEDNIFTPRRLYGLTTSGLAYVFAADGGGSRVGSLVSIRLGVDEGATGTSQLADVDLMGYVF